MKTIKTISISQFCNHYDVPNSFIDNLIEYELIELIEKNNKKYIVENQLHHIEKLIRLHYDLAINFEGLDVINNLLQRIENLEQELNSINNHFK
jgi:hypothetical protein